LLEIVSQHVVYMDATIISRYWSVEVDQDNRHMYYIFV